VVNFNHLCILINLDELRPDCLSSLGKTVVFDVSELPFLNLTSRAVQSEVRCHLSEVELVVWIGGDPVVKIQGLSFIVDYHLLCTTHFKVKLDSLRVHECSTVSLTRSVVSFKP
jgi:hypothetical protein